MGRKNLDHLFQEKLKDFSEVPDEKVWQSIETALDKKKKSRKAIPIWWKLGGVAAILLIAITLINPFDEGPNQVPAVTEVENSSERASEEDKIDQNSDAPNESQIVDVEEGTISNSNDPTVKQVVETETRAKENSNSQQVQTSAAQEQFKNQKAIEVQVVLSDEVAFKKGIDQKTDTSPESEFAPANRDSEIVETNSAKANEAEKTDLKNQGVKENALLNEIQNTAKDAIAEEKQDEFKEDMKESESKKKSILDAIAEQQEEDVAEVETGSRWSAGPSIAPVYYDAIGEGSPVHSIFVPNSKSGDVNLSYGLSVAYEVSKKLSIRSGLHKVDYGYRTNEVEFSSSLESTSNGQIDNIDYTITSKNLVVSSKVNTRIEALNQNPFLDTSSSDVSAASAAREGTMEQQFGYLEVPVELNYALVDNRFGVNLIGGISSLFLVDNSISLNSGELTTEMGEANNVNSVNFSTNVGFGVNYKFTPKVRLNIEPVFKYQLNTFSETDGTFNPFSIGVYSGLSFKF